MCLLGVSVGVGIASAADTLGSQAFGGRNKKLVGLTLQRGVFCLAVCIAMIADMCGWMGSGILILGLVMFPCAGLWLNAGKDDVALSMTATSDSCDLSRGHTCCSQD